MNFPHNFSDPTNPLSQATYAPAEGETVGHLGSHLTHVDGRTAGGMIPIVHDAEILRLAAGIERIACACHLNNADAAIVRMISMLSGAIVNGHCQLALVVGSKLHGLFNHPTGILVACRLDELNADTSGGTFEFLYSFEGTVQDAEIAVAIAIQSMLRGTTH
jgi:hypothetical protein